jgi:hypothetical protein
LDDISIVEEKEFNMFFKEIESQVSSFEQLCQKVLCFILNTRKRVVNPSGLQFDQKELFGPSPYLYFGE